MLAKHDSFSVSFKATSWVMDKAYGLITAMHVLPLLAVCDEAWPAHHSQIWPTHNSGSSKIKEEWEVLDLSALGGIATNTTQQFSLRSNKHLESMVQLV